MSSSPSFQQRLIELQNDRKALAQKESAFTHDRLRALASLPNEYGYESLQSFVSALKIAQQKHSAKKKVLKNKSPKASAPRKKKRGKVTPEVKQAVIAAVQSKKPASKIAKSLGISVATVNAIKKAAGLVKPRKRKG